MIVFNFAVELLCKLNCMVYKNMHAPCLVVTLPASLHTACLPACMQLQRTGIHACFNATIGYSNMQLLPPASV